MAKGIFIFHFCPTISVAFRGKAENTESELTRRKYTVVASNMHFQKYIQNPVEHRRLGVKGTVSNLRFHMRIIC